jgi:hypothetical protein
VSERAPQFFVVPAGTPLKQCRSEACLKPIFFIAHPRTGRAHPVDCNVKGGLRPSVYGHGVEQANLFGPPEVAHDGRGVSHFETCPDAASFRHGVGA